MNELVKWFELELFDGHGQQHFEMKLQLHFNPRAPTHLNNGTMQYEIILQTALDNKL